MKKGFTLIELLAVIVIIAIIALIAIPQITKVVDNAKESANLRSVEGHIGTLEYQFALNPDGISDGNHSFSDFTFRNYPSKDKIR